MFVTFSCGCVGIRPDSGRPIVIRACDLRPEDCHDPLGFARKDMTEESFESLPANEAEALIRDLDRLLADGYRFRQIRNLLNRPEVP